MTSTLTRQTAESAFCSHTSHSPRGTTARSRCSRRRVSAEDVCGRVSLSASRQERQEKGRSTTDIGERREFRQCADSLHPIRPIHTGDRNHRTDTGRLHNIFHTHSGTFHFGSHSCNERHYFQPFEPFERGSRTGQAGQPGQPGRRGIFSRRPPSGLCSVGKLERNAGCGKTCSDTTGYCPGPQLERISSVAVQSYPWNCSSRTHTTCGHRHPGTKAQYETEAELLRPGVPSAITFPIICPETISDSLRGGAPEEERQEGKDLWEKSSCGAYYDGVQEKATRRQAHEGQVNVADRVRAIEQKATQSQTAALARRATGTDVMGNKLGKIGYNIFNETAS